MRKAIIIFLFLVCASYAMASAAAPDQLGLTEQPKVSVLVFLDKMILTNEKAMGIIRPIINERFKQANIVFYGDEQSKSPEFLEFMEQVQTDPVNEKGIRTISRSALMKYGKDTSSAYIVLVNISVFDRYYIYKQPTFDMKQQISVVDIAKNKIIEDVAWHKEGIKWGSQAAEYFMNMLKNQFSWDPSSISFKKNKIAPTDSSNLSIVVFLPDTILEKAESVELVRKTVSTKFNVSNVPIYIDDKPKSAEFLDLISKVSSDSTKQRTFILKKEHLIQYGKAINTNSVVAINISVTKEEGWSVRLKEDIFIVDVESGKYLMNTVFDTSDTMSRPAGIEYLMEKLQKEFVLPSI